MAKVVCSDETPSPEANGRSDTTGKLAIAVLPASQPRHSPPLTNHRLFLLSLWVGAVLTPWLLQLRSFVNLATPHKISQDLLPYAAQPLTENITTICPVRGLMIANIWWNLDPTHYYTKASGRFLCHFVIPQYNMHGNNYVTGSKKAPNLIKCEQDVWVINYYFYHGSVGYLAFYEEGHGELCKTNMQASMKVGKLGSADLNGEALANDVGEEGYRSSTWFVVYCIVWLGFRALVMRRSFVLFKRFIARHYDEGERILPHDAIIYIQECARLTAHSANNFHRAGILYFLLEGLMTDLYMMITTEGVRGLVQSLSLGYNLASLLSVLFEMIESRSCFRRSWRLRAIKRLLFNHESSIIGECACAFAVQFFLTITNRSKVSETLPVTEAVSFYLWGLIGHLVPVSMIIILLVTIRTVGTVSLMWWKYRSLTPITAPCCVDVILGVRQKLAYTTGYRIRSDGLYFPRKSLGVYSLLQTVSGVEEKRLVQPEVYWFATPRNGLVAIGVVFGSAVDQCNERRVLGDVALCDQTLGGPVSAGPDSSQATARLPIQSKKYAA